MSWANDAHGIVFQSREIKLYKDGGHTWAMKLSQIAKQSGAIRIITYSLPRLHYVEEQLSRRPYGIWIICHSKFLTEAKDIKRNLPKLKIAVHDGVHSKVCLIAPCTIYIGSANFGVSGWHETEIGVRSKAAYSWYLHHSFIPLWDESKVIEGLIR